MRRLALATCREYPRLLEDDLPLAEALARRGVVVETTLWDEPRDWRRYDGVLLRSAWDYYRRLDEFLAWLAALERAGVRCWNPPALVRWNADKRYLKDLAARGVRVPQTLWFERGSDPAAAARAVAAAGWEDLVLKPTVSGGAWRTLRLRAAEAPRHVEAMAQVLADAGLMAQPFLPQVVRHGEVSLLFFAGEYSHAALKRPAPGDWRVQWTHGGTQVPFEPGPVLLEDARTALAAAPEPGLYARVDGVLQEGRLLLMELEQIEPFLFLAQGPSAAERLAAALERALG